MVSRTGWLPTRSVQIGVTTERLRFQEEMTDASSKKKCTLDYHCNKYCS